MSSKPWYHKGLRFTCKRSGNCCRSHGEYAYVRIDTSDCPFLTGEPGCAIYPVRPAQCSSWPFWKDNLDDPARWHGDVMECCPGIGHGELHSCEEVERRAQELEDWFDPA